MGLNKKLETTERAEIKAALTRSNGNIRAAAAELGIGQSSMQDRIRRKYPELGRHADRLKKRHGLPSHGRHAKRDGVLSRKSVRSAWKRHKTISGAARELGKPAMTVRAVLIEYGYYEPGDRVTVASMSRDTVSAAWDKHKTISGVAEELGCANQTAKKALARFEIA